MIARQMGDTRYRGKIVWMPTLSAANHIKAMAAGPEHTLAVRVERRADGSLAVEVEDDAGGFELGDEHGKKRIFLRHSVILPGDYPGFFTVSCRSGGACSQRSARLE